MEPSFSFGRAGGPEQVEPTEGHEISPSISDEEVPSEHSWSKDRKKQCIYKRQAMRHSQINKEKPTQKATQDEVNTLKLRADGGSEGGVC